MNRIKYLLFTFLCFFSLNVYAENEVLIEKVTPIYDEASAVVLTEISGQYSVKFNDKDQSVKYKITLRNATTNDLKISDINFNSLTESFLKYEITGLNKNDIIKSDETKDFVLSLKTVKQDGWGRNFDNDLTVSINFTDNIINPETGNVVLFFIFILFVLGIIVSWKKKSFRKFIFPVIIMCAVFSRVNAKNDINLKFNINVSFESKNIMESIGYDYYEAEGELVDYWKYSDKIKNFYVENEKTDISEYVYRFDVSALSDESVIAYLVENPTDATYYDLHLQADGVIYPNQNAHGYFCNMKYLDKIYNIDGIDTSKVTDMSYMFDSTGMESEVFKLDLGNYFDTSNVTNMNSMFFNTGSDNPSFELKLGNKFNTSNVTNMYFMFAGAGFDSEVFTLDLSGFNTSNVTNMRGMFMHTGYTNHNFTLNLGDSFDTGKVTTMHTMFEGTGFNSNKFNVSILIKNPGTAYYSSIFRDVAMEDGTSLVVNYTSDTEDLVDLMLATKTAGSYVRKGILVDK